MCFFISFFFFKYSRSLVTVIVFQKNISFLCFFFQGLQRNYPTVKNPTTLAVFFSSSKVMQIIDVNRICVSTNRVLKKRSNDNRIWYSFKQK